VGSGWEKDAGAWGLLLRVVERWGWCLAIVGF